MTTIQINDGVENYTVPVTTSVEAAVDEFIATYTFGELDARVATADEYATAATELAARLTVGTAEVKCPKCLKANRFANEDGAVDGPREYHAACWSVASETMTDAEREAAYAASQLPA